jgi:peptidoglycan/LPS O-acetylase OafA/YrhL
MRNAGGWLQGIQYFRAIAIINVVAYHAVTIGVLVSNPLWTVVAVHAFTSFGVPFFVFISGVVLYNKYNNEFSLATFYKKRLSAVVPPYIVWNTFWFVMLLLPAVFTLQPGKYPIPIPIPTGYTPNTPGLSFATLASAYAGQLATGFEYLWFIRVIILLYLLYPILEKMYNRAKRQNSPIYVLAVLLLVQIAYNSLAYSYLGTVVPTAEQWFTALGVFGYILYYVFFLTYVFYFVLGFYVAQHYEAMKRSVAKLSLKSISLVVLAAAIYYVPVYYYGVGYLYSPPIPLCGWLNVFTAPFYCLLLILFYLRICTTWGEPRGLFLSYLEKIGEDSFGIYLVHFLFFGITFVPLALLGLTIYDPLLYPLWFLLTIVSSYVAVEAIYHLPFSYILIGARRKKRTSVDRELTLARPA